MQQNQTKATRTRQFIIESTANVFNKKGFGGTSLTDLTSATGLTKGSIYGNFQNKEEVAAAAFDFNWSRVVMRVEAELAKQSTAKDKLLAYVSIYKVISNDAIGWGGCPLMNTAVDADDTNPLLREKALKAYLKWKNTLVNLIKMAIAAGDFRSDINPQKAAIPMIAMIEGGLMIAKLTGQSKNLMDVMDAVEGYINSMVA